MRAITRVAAAIVLAAVLVYVADAAWAWLRTTDHHPPTGSVQVRVMLAVPQKSGRVEFVPGGIETQTCARALFPHFGLEPCWYVERHTRRQVDF